MKLTSSKSSLAKIMANEDLIVEQRSGIPSAFFDTDSRLLVVPEFKDSVSVNVLDLMLSHEVSHSLHTPNEEWVNAVREQKINKSILNVVCDARIERLIKNKYPGLRKIYHYAYKELFDNNFFGTSETDFTTLNLIDRINLYFKVGYIEKIPFSDEEMVFVTAAENTQTFSDVVKLSKEIQEHIKQQLEKQFEELKAEEEYSSSNEQSDSFGMKGSLSTESSMETEENDDEIDDEYSGTLELEEFLENELKSRTQEASEYNIKDLYKDNGKQSIYVDLPSNNLNDIIIDYAELFCKLKAEIKPESINTKSYITFKNETFPMVSYLAKEFNLKKNAKGRKKEKISKTGDLNLNKLYSYKTSDDIFKRNSITPKEQSHGLVFFLDWSGSMTEYFVDTIKQLVTLLLFCKKVNIPFEVYAFTTSMSYDERENGPKIKTNELILHPLKLMNLFSSRMSSVEFIEACNYLLSCNGQRFYKDSCKNVYATYNYLENPSMPYWFSLGNTPLNHAIVFSNKVMEDFKNRTKVQIANAIYLTDGESHNVKFSVIERNKYDNEKSMKFRELGGIFYDVYLRDRVSKETMKYTKTYNIFGETNQCVKFMKQFCDFKMFAFRLLKSAEIKSAYYKITEGKSLISTKEFNKNNCLEIKTNFDKFYFVKANLLNVKEELDDIEGKTATNIAKDFTKIMNKKINTRIFMTKFIDFIS